MERWIRLHGANNTRDLGGYQTRDGRTVKPGHIYRSGELSGLSAAGFRKLRDKYHVRQLVDLRTADEIAGCPLPETCPIPIQHNPILKHAMRGITRDSEPMRKKMQAILAFGMTETEFMGACYDEMVSSPDARDGYHRLFSLLLEREEGATLFFCSAGRDRTGLAAFLILFALGVPEDEILDDYLLTPRSIRRKAFGVRILKALRRFDHAEAEFALAFMLPSQARIHGALNAIERTYGNIEAFLRDGIGLADTDIERLREKYLE